ncbi:Patatin/Phospholipase A2-related protein [Acididesulfobacillus acetoxydans]|uniref:Patatin/Phospholipase A2-related protein n=1 Tax=Acididesulfobacillus acetoxydans TaxID=1561005 RepID=A0A8S0XCP9_9FIRM|nr:patatin-like phospholipase family protein [Acididesulfobacillus acetoxydans]CAA7602736.1 Patatin/Phospholipase A2-related protein [Acididesulfobacillus acetoxydans]CEJ06407.1 Phospholipase, patatin [Acididesulfobacillus acetoxydans]
MGKKGLVLGAGGARGFAHLGVLQVLREENIRPDLVVGCSAGAIFGAIWATGLDLERVERLLIYPGFTKRLFDVSVPREGLFKGDRVLEVMRLLTRDATFEDLEVPLAVVATDLETGDLVVFREGSVAQAVRASISIPGVFRPYRYQDRLLVDGAVKNRLPVHVAREMGAEKVLAVDVKKGLNGKIGGTLDVLMQSVEILQEEVFRSHCLDADLLLQPEVGHIGSLQFDAAAETIDIGREAALAQCSEIRRLME